MVNNRSHGARAAAKKPKAAANKPAVAKAAIHPGSRFGGFIRLAEILYPPESAAAKLWGQVKWAHARWRVRTMAGRRLINHVGIYLRKARVDGAPALICGIGGVMTQPEHQGQHHTTRAMEMACTLAMERGADFGLLVCEKKNIPLYRKMGWFVFGGTMLHRQPGRGTLPWTLSPVMVRDLNGKAPRRGTIDIRGKPW